MFIKAARIGAPFGLQGGLHLYPYSEQRDHLLEVPSFYYQEGTSYFPMKINSIKTHGNHLRVFLELVPDRTAAEKWVGRDLFVKAQELPALPEGRYYWHQLEGLQIKNLSGSDLGTVKSLYSNGPQDVLVTSFDEQIPFILGQTISKVDLSQKVLYVLFEDSSYDATPED